MNDTFERILRKTIVVGAVLTFLASSSPSQILEPATLDALVEGAETPADHMKLAMHYDAQARAMQERADQHRATGARYAKKGLAPKAARTWREMSGHCDRLSRAYASIAKESRELAAMHRALGEADR